MNLFRKIRSASKLFEEQGIAAVASKGVGLVYDATTVLVFQRDLTLPAPEMKSTVPFELRKINDKTFESFRNMPNPFPRHYEYRRDYRQRHSYGAYVGSRIAALLWVMFQADNRQIVNAWRDLLPDEARVGNIWADPQYRGTGLMGACLEHLFDYLACRGIRYQYAFVPVGNEASKRLHNRHRFKIVGKAWNFRLAWQKPGSGFFYCQRIPRLPVAERHPGGDIELPEVIPTAVINSPLAAD